MGSDTVVEGFRLSLQQRRIWAMEQEGAGSAAQCAIAIDGALDRAALEGAVQSLVNRHEILRTTFRRLPGMTLPVQVVAQTGAPAWRRVDLSERAPGEQEAAARATGRGAGATPRSGG